MRRLWQGIAVLLLILFVVSCAPRHMMKQEPMQKPSAGKAIVNFMRPSSFGGAVQATIWDSDKLIGFTAGKMAFQYECDPGKHLFIAWSDALTWKKTLPNYKPDPSAIAEVEAKNHPKIIKYLQKYHTEIAGTKHVQYLRPEDGVPMEE